VIQSGMKTGDNHKIERNEKMTENDKKEKNYFAPVVEFDNKTSLITRIGFTASATDKYEIVWPIPANDEEAKDRYDCTIQDLVEAGIRQLSTRPNYKEAGFFTDKDKENYGELRPGGHEAMQELADSYKIGVRKAGVSQKATVKKVKTAEAELDMSFDDMVKKLAELKEQGLV